MAPASTPRLPTSLVVSDKPGRCTHKVLAAQELYPDSPSIRKPSCHAAESGFYRRHDTDRLPGQSIAARPARIDARWVGGPSSAPAGECAVVAGRRDELRSDCAGAVSGRRHDPHLAPSV